MHVVPEGTFCRFCSEPRFNEIRGRGERTHKRIPKAILKYLPLTPWLQQLYRTSQVAEQMTWHATHEAKDGVCVIH